MTTQKETTPRKSRWGIGIALLYGGFALFMLIVVIFVSTKHYDLVEPDYYAQELKHQDKIDAQARTESLPQKPEIVVEAAGNKLRVVFPPELMQGEITGSIALYRPSNERWDRTHALALSETGEQIIPLDSLAPGFWRVKLEWEAGGQEYYLEDKFLLQK